MSEEEKVLPVYKSEERIEFEEQRKDWSDRDIQMEMLYDQQVLVAEQHEMLNAQYNLIRSTEKVRANTNTLIWWLIAIPIILGIILGVIFA